MKVVLLLFCFSLVILSCACAPFGEAFGQVSGDRGVVDAAVAKSQNSEFAMASSVVQNGAAMAVSRVGSRNPGLRARAVRSAKGYRVKYGLSG